MVVYRWKFKIKKTPDYWMTSVNIFTSLWHVHLHNIWINVHYLQKISNKKYQAGWVWVARKLFCGMRCLQPVPHATNKTLTLKAIKEFIIPLTSIPRFLKETILLIQDQFESLTVCRWNIFNLYYKTYYSLNSLLNIIFLQIYLTISLSIKIFPTD